MSIRFILAFLLSIALVTCGSLFAKSFLLAPDETKLSSIELEKEAFLKPHKHNHPKHTHKLAGPLTTTIRIDSEDKSKNVKAVYGKVVSYRRLQNVLVRWQLPGNANVVSGQIEILIPELLPHQPYELSLQIESPPEENTQVHLLASTTMGAQRTSHGSQINIVAPIESAAVDQ